MVVRTRRSFPCSASTVWSLMCNSRMDESASLFFRLGVPQPVECRVSDLHPGVGSERECISDRGVVRQRILVWAPDRCLTFRMESTDLRLGRYLQDLVDTFELDATPDGVGVTRTTRVRTRGLLQFLARPALFLSLRKVHGYVFRNWEQLAREGPPSPVSAERGSPTVPAS